MRQVGSVGFWPISDFLSYPLNGRFWGISGRAAGEGSVGGVGSNNDLSRAATSMLK